MKRFILTALILLLALPAAAYFGSSPFGQARFGMGRFGTDGFGGGLDSGPASGSVRITTSGDTRVTTGGDTRVIP